MRYNPEQLADMAQAALLYEVMVQPKPGLVDPVDSGPHHDMNAFTFVNSAISLKPYLQEASRLGMNFAGTDMPRLFNQLRAAGRKAEQTMFAATHGVNTHKGAIFSLGIAVGATAHWCKTRDYDTDGVRRLVKRMLTGLTKHDMGRVEAEGAEAELTAGERQYLRFRSTGARGEAEQGFPSVMEVALPFLRNAEGPLNVRLLDTLMTLAGHVEDTNLVKRAGTRDVLEWMRSQCNRYFELGGAGSAEGMEFLLELNNACVERNLSLGGCADLLILTIFFGLLEGVIHA
ncbi:triphosphoribosyl-dephospho-CoA synthase CitG [Bifidobacterium sp. ESL0798]|uniref:triphosphoribosyl-dephospho-CoA synthase CitG n=1 Tax=Bifidobacterium sp. ESL0798 TaxID=2983235 RepID=UPI0023F6AC19|nr:triphosphoribosyl-dephospho-CoA synthase CitG [Bifidobacterium sp. ESL0798]WEV73770.1 triphosphoribosyl-dephospho-CoA synthase CitG [Bifidobacterium sp. ESL0798]